MNFEFRPGIVLSGAVIWSKYWLQGDISFLAPDITKFMMSFSKINYKTTIIETEGRDEFNHHTYGVNIEWKRIGIAAGFDFEDLENNKWYVGPLYYKGHLYRGDLRFFNDIRDVTMGFAGGGNKLTEYGCIILLPLKSLRDFTKGSSYSYRKGWGSIEAYNMDDFR